MIEQYPHLEESLGVTADEFSRPPHKPGQSGAERREGGWRIERFSTPRRPGAGALWRSQTRGGAAIFPLKNRTHRAPLCPGL